MWGIGFFVILIGALGMMWLASRNSTARTPSPTARAEQTVNFEITDQDHVKGVSTAATTIVEWSDFQCPACAAYQPVLKALMEEYPEDVRIVYKHFPLKTIHFMAESAARAAEAAALQGKFWEMHDLLFERQQEWSRASTDIFMTYANDLGLNVEQFRADFESEAVRQGVNDDFQYALDLNLSSTPTFYINGELTPNPSSYEAFAEIVEANRTPDLE